MSSPLQVIVGESSPVISDIKSDWPEPLYEILLSDEGLHHNSAADEIKIQVKFDNLEASVRIKRGEQV